MGKFESYFFFLFTWSRISSRGFSSRDQIDETVSSRLGTCRLDLVSSRDFRLVRLYIQYFPTFPKSTNKSFCFILNSSTYISGHHPRAFSPSPLSASSFPVSVVRIVFCHSGLNANSHIDAVALLGKVLNKCPNSVVRFSLSK